MKAFTLKIKELFKLDTNKTEANFCADKRKLLIPLYQREYKWSNEKITTLFNDIKKHEKFLGNIILDEMDSNYQIVDGQQRITTCYIILLCLFNYYERHTRDQQALKNYIKPYNNEFLLCNDSVGNYIHEHDNKMEICVSEDENIDIYFQKDDFERAYRLITSLINEFNEQSDVANFKNNLLECELLVLINVEHTQTSPVEQLFLDINEKAQLLEVEDIFKGHCFENYQEDAHDDLRNLWVELKKCSIGFKRFGFENTSQFLYLYLLETDSTNIPEKLTTNGKHYLDGKTMDETEQLLLNMTKYGTDVLDFYDNIHNTGYRFVDLCANSNEYRNQRDHLILKEMCKTMLEPRGKAQYQKLPLMYLIYGLLANEDITNTLSHRDFRKIITNLYVYTSVFVFNGVKKSKNDVDHTIRDALMNENIPEIVSAAKALRIGILENFSLPTSCDFKKLSFICSIIDNYNSNDNWLPLIYSHVNSFNLEHLIIPDNSDRKIEWVDGERSFTITLPAAVKSYKKKTINFLILNETLNGEIEHDDIITKIDKIREWYSTRGENLPNHIGEIFDYIESMPQYNALKNMKNTEVSQQEIREAYMNFINAYFDEENTSLLVKMQTLFKQSFQNN